VTLFQCRWIYFLVLIALLSAGCSKDDNSTNPPGDYSFLKIGSEQRGRADEYLADSIGINVLKSDLPVTGLKVSFGEIKGGGSVEETQTAFNSTNHAYTLWELGHRTSVQHVTAHIQAADDKDLGTFEFRALCFRDNTWDTIPDEPERQFTDMIFDTDSNYTLAMTANSLFRQGDRYFDWEIVSSAETYSPYTLEIDSNHMVYLGTKTGNLYKSSDKGNTWVACTKPYKNLYGYFDMRVTGDKVIWVCAPGYPLSYSEDGGNTWVETTKGQASNEQMLDVYRFSNGLLLFHARSHRLYLSHDHAFSWVPVTTPAETVKTFVTDQDLLVIICDEGVYSFYVSIDYATGFVKKFEIPGDFGMDLEHTFQSNNGVYYIVVPGAGLLRTTNFEIFQMFYQNDMLEDVFADREGSLITTETFRRRAFYWHTDGTK
jgi:hypothetical protein